MLHPLGCGELILLSTYYYQLPLLPSASHVLPITAYYCLVLPSTSYYYYYYVGFTGLLTPSSHFTK